MKLCLLFYMCHLTMGLTRCYKTAVFYMYHITRSAVTCGNKSINRPLTTLGTMNPLDLSANHAGQCPHSALCLPNSRGKCQFLTNNGHFRNECTNKWWMVIEWQNSHTYTCTYIQWDKGRSCHRAPSSRGGEVEVKCAQMFRCAIALLFLIWFIESNLVLDSVWQEKRKVLSWRTGSNLCGSA